MRLLLSAGFCLLGALSSTASAEGEIRVAILDGQASVSLRSASGLVRDGDRSSVRPVALRFTVSSGGALPARIRAQSGVVSVNGRSYRGSIEVHRKKNGTLLVVNQLDIEEYLKGVVASEIPYDWEDEALKAQAVVSRTYALYRKRVAGKRLFHISATVQGQVYDGLRGERPEAVRAVQATRGRVLAYDDEVIPAFYHSSCGGHTEDASTLWDVDVPYLKGVECVCQEISKYAEWERRFSTGVIAAALRKIGYRMREILDARPGRWTSAGRMRELELVHDGGIMSVPLEQLRRAIGYSEIPSAFLEVSVSNGEVVFSGRGLGHGVGMCQWGARRFAQLGYDYEQILRHYYPGATLN